MKLLLLTFLLTSSPTFATEEVITENDRFIDAKTGKYVRVCEIKNGELIVKESCGKFWDTFPRKRADLIKEVKTYKDLDERALVLVPVKNKNADTKMILGKVSFMYENGQINVMEYYSSRFGYNPGTTNWKFNYQLVKKLNKAHPLVNQSELCVKEDTEINYNYNDNRKFSLKKGEKVFLKGIFENEIAAISLDSFLDNFQGYGLDNQLPIELKKLEVCANEETNNAITDSSRSQIKDHSSVQDHLDSTAQPTSKSK